MAENFDIRITDHIDPSILNKLEAIALKAISAHTAIEKMEQSLASVGSKSLDQMGSSQARLAADINKASLAYLNQEISLNRAITAESKALKSTEQLAQAKNRTATSAEVAAAAHNKAKKSLTDSAAAEQRLATATQQTENARTKGTVAATQATTAEQRLQAATAQAAASKDRAAQASIKLQRERDKEIASLIKLANLSAAPVDTGPTNIQKQINASVGVDRGESKSAKDSASAFKEAFANEAKLQADAEKAAAQATKERNQALREADQELKRLEKSQREAERGAADLERRAVALINAFDPLTSAHLSHNKALSEAAALLRQGVITQQQYDTVVSNSTKALHENTRGLEANGKATGFSRNQLLTFQYTFNDVVASLASGGSLSTIFFQQIGQVTQAFNGTDGTLKSIVQGLGAYRVAMIAAGTATAAAGALILAGQSEAARFRNILDLTSNSAGFTADSFERMAARVSAANNVSVSSSRALANELLQAGNIQAEQIEQIVFVTQRLSKATGQSTDEIVQQWINAADAPSNYAERLLKLGLIRSTVVQHIRDIEEAGDKTRAFNVLARSLYDFMGTKAPESVNIVSRAFSILSVKISDASRDFRNFLMNLTGNVGEMKEIAEIEKRLGEAREKFAKVPANAPEFFKKIYGEPVRQLEAQLAKTKELQAANEKAAKTASQTAAGDRRALDLGKQADGFLGMAKGAEIAADKINDVKKLMRELREIDPRHPKLLELEKNFGSIASELKKRYDPQPKPRKPSDASLGKNEEYNRAIMLGAINDELDTQAASYDKLARARNVDMTLSRLEVQLARQNLRALSDTERAQLQEKLTRNQLNAETTASIDAIYNESRAYANAHESALNAIQILSKKDAVTGKSIISTREAEIATRKADYAYKEATDSLADFNREVEDNFRLLTMSADRRFVEGPILQKKRQLEPQGKELSREEEDYMRRSLQMMQERERQTRALDAIEAATVGTKKELVAQQKAIILAQQEGYLTASTYKNAVVQLHTSFANFNLSQGIGTFEESVMASLARMVEGFTNAKHVLSQSFGEFFQGFQDGFARAVGAAMFQGGSFKERFKELTKSIMADLVASLIKVGLQLTINKVLFDSWNKTATVGTATQAAQEVAAIGVTTTAKVAAGKIMVAAAAENAIALAAIGSAIATAWAPAAAAVSLATQGANAVLATAGIAATHAASKLASAPIPGFEAGGYTGDVGRSSIAGLVHGQEFVVNAQATARNRATLEAMNNGKQSRSGDGWTVEVNNYGTPQTYEVQSIDEGRIRLIARDEARGVVAKEAPSVIANDIRNPNSSTSKGLRDTHNVSRRR